MVVGDIIAITGLLILLYTQSQTSLLIWKGEDERLLRLYSLANKNAGNKRTHIQQKGARIKRFGTTDQGELPWSSGEEEFPVPRGGPTGLKAEQGPSFSHPLGSATLA